MDGGGWPRATLSFGNNGGRREVREGARALERCPLFIAKAEHLKTSATSANDRQNGLDSISAWLRRDQTGGGPRRARSERRCWLEVEDLGVTGRRSSREARRHARLAIGHESGLWGALTRRGSSASHGGRLGVTCSWQWRAARELVEAALVPSSTRVRV